MEIFNLDKTTYKSGEIINFNGDVTWVERYSKPGEFTIKTEPNPYILDAFALGSLISHTETRSVMMVENIEIDETKENDPSVTITGRTADVVIMENRVIANTNLWSTAENYHNSPRDLNYAWPYSQFLLQDDVWDQIVLLIKRYIKSAWFSSNDELPNIDVVHTVTGTDTDAVERWIEPLTLLSDAVYDLLKNNDLGLKLERPVTGTKLKFIIHAGQDKADIVNFNWQAGDLDSVKYFFSLKNYKNAFIVSDSQFIVDYLKSYDPGDGTPKILWPKYSGWALRYAAVDKKGLEELPFGHSPVTLDDYQTLANRRNLLLRSGLEVLKNSPVQELLEATVSSDARFSYGVDYDIGDIVWVEGNYGVANPLRITEYARIIDANGERSYPTLSTLNPDS